MARGDAWRFSGGIYIPNPRFLIDSDYDWTATENLPDAWTKTITSGTCTTNIADGFSSGRCLRIANNASGTNTIQSGRSPAGGIPQRAKTAGLQARLRLVFWYKKDSGNQTLTPILNIYNADESVVVNNSFAGITSLASTWTKYDATILINLSQPSLGIYPDHCRLTLQIGGSATAVNYHVSDFTLSYRLLDIDGSNGYDTVVGYPSPTGLTYEPIQLGAFERTHLGQMRRIDTTGGMSVMRLSGHWEIARDADAKLFRAMRALNEGLYCPEDNGSPAPCVGRSPIVIEPFQGDGATQSAGKMPENFYAWMTEPPNLEPVGYLGNVWSGSIGFEELG